MHPKRVIASSRLWSKCAALALGLAAANLLPAQLQAPAATTTPAQGKVPVVPAKPATAAVTDTTNEVVELSPFSVNASDDIGYRAANTLAGSRLNTSLKDTPGSLDVLTAEFMADIGATTLEQALAFSTNFAEDIGDFDSQNVTNTIFPSSQVNTVFRNRGLKGSISRNYLQTDSRPAFYTVERIDNSSGPNSILFGLGDAGGVANISTKRARLNRNSTGLNWLVDSFGTVQVTADFNKVIIPEVWGLRLNALATKKDKFKENFWDDTTGFHLASTFRATKTMEIRAEYEQEHTTGTVAYPGPNQTHTYVLNWLDRGSPIYDLPVGWETLSATARNALVNPAGSPTAFTFASGTISPVVMQTGDYAFVANVASSLWSHINPGNQNGSDLGQTLDPRVYTPKTNIGGPGAQKGVDREILAFAIDQKLGEKFYFNLSAATENSQAQTYQPLANGASLGATIMADGNGTLPYSSQVQNLGGAALQTNALGQVINPFKGQFFADTYWRNRKQESTRDIIQATLAGELDFGRWLGSHRVVAMASYQESTSWGDQFDESWMFAPFNADPTNAGNRLRRRGYAISPLDAKAWHVPDWRNLPVVTWNHPTRGPISSGWVSVAPNARDVEQYSYSGALQSRLLNNRLVLTAGYRWDDATNFVTNQTKRVKPPGWEATTGLLELDYDKTTESVDEGATHSIGGVFHLTEWMSVFANKSSNFGPPGGRTVGPDATIPEATFGNGLDYGLKFALFNNRLFIDVAYFETSSDGVAEVMNVNLATDGSIRGSYNGVFNILDNPATLTNQAPGVVPPIFDKDDAAAVAKLRQDYSQLVPFYNAAADLQDQSSRGYELRLTANPTRNIRLRATFSYTNRERENLYVYSLPMAEQLRSFVGALKTANPSRDIGNLVLASAPPAVPNTTTVDSYLNTLDLVLDQNIENFGNNFGGGKMQANLTATYDFDGKFKGLGATVSTRYASAAYTGPYEVRAGGLSTGALIATEPTFGNSSINWDLGLRYRTKIGPNRKTNLILQLNVFNVLDQDDPLVRRIRTIVIAPGAPAPTPDQYIPSSYYIRDPRRWQLSAGFNF